MLSLVIIYSYLFNGCLLIETFMDPPHPHIISSFMYSEFIKYLKENQFMFIEILVITWVLFWYFVLKWDLNFICQFLWFLHHSTRLEVASYINHLIKKIVVTLISIKINELYIKGCKHIICGLEKWKTEWKKYLWCSLSFMVTQDKPKLAKSANLQTQGWNLKYYQDK